MCSALCGVLDMGRGFFAVSFFTSRICCYFYTVLRSGHASTVPENVVVNVDKAVQLSGVSCSPPR